MPSLLQRLRRVAPYFRPSRPGLWLAALAAAVSAATEPMIPALLKPLLDKGFTGRDLSLWQVPVAIIGLYLVRGIASFVSSYALTWSTNAAVLALRERMFARLLDAAPAMFSRHTASGLTNTLVYEVQSGADRIVSALLTLVRDSLSIVALFGYLLWLNWRLTLFVLLLAPAVAVVMRVVSRRLHKLAVQGQHATDDLAYVVEENVMAWRIVRLHGAGQAQQSRFRTQGQRLRRLVLKSAAAGAIVSPITQLLAALALSAVIAAALWQAQYGAGTSVGDFVAFVTAMLMMTSPMKHLADVAAPLTKGVTALERGIALVEEVQPERGGTHVPAGRARGELRLEGVGLRYRDDQPAAIDGVDLVLRAGETVALVGPSGAGKSSLVNLLPRFVDPSAGRIVLDGVPLPDWDIGALRRQFALVSQDVVLFNDSLGANVALGDDFDEARVQAALRDANLAGFVERLPQGIATPVGHNGSQLSGGQRQRLAIARAIYKDAPILILDEATSALDSESERAVQTALERLMQGRTTLVIAHRLSTIEHADRVVAMEHGRVVEQGTHAELLARGGLYARLHTMQFRQAA